MVTLLPQPLSPTTPSTWPGMTSKLVPSTAHQPSSIAKETEVADRQQRGRSVVHRRLRVCEFFGGWLHTYLTLRNGAKRSVSKGGTARAYASLERGSFVLRFPSFETLRFATLLRMRWKARDGQCIHSSQLL